MTMQTFFFKENHEALAPDSDNGAAAGVCGLGSLPVAATYTFGDTFRHSMPASLELSAGGNRSTHVSKEFEHRQGVEKGNATHLTLFSDSDLGNYRTAETGVKTKPQMVSSVVPDAATVEYQGRFSLGFGKPLICAQYPYTEQYGVYSTYGSEIAGRVVLPLGMTDDGGPIYVNAKQYNGIMRRRKSRAKAGMENKVVKARKPYMHLSRHLHAVRRPRGTGGRFLNTKGLKSSDEKTGLKKTNTGGNHRPQPTESNISEVLQYDGGIYSKGMDVRSRSPSIGSKVTGHRFSGNTSSLHQSPIDHLRASFQPFPGMASTGLGIAMATTGNYLKV